MEELLPKLIELGALGIINILLIWKGVPAMNKLSDSSNQLAAAIDKLTNSVNNRLDMIEHDLRDVKNSLDLILRRVDFFEKNQYNRKDV